jgi:hypothetical protein
VDIKRHEYAVSVADEFILGDLCDQRVIAEAVDWNR